MAPLGLQQCQAPFGPTLHGNTKMQWPLPGFTSAKPLSGPPWTAGAHELLLLPLASLLFYFFLTTERALPGTFFAETGVSRCGGFARFDLQENRGRQKKSNVS